VWNRGAYDRKSLKKMDVFQESVILANHRKKPGEGAGRLKAKMSEAALAGRHQSSTEGPTRLGHEVQAGAVQPGL